MKYIARTVVVILLAAFVLLAGFVMFVPYLIAAAFGFSRAIFFLTMIVVVAIASALLDNIPKG